MHLRQLDNSLSSRMHRQPCRAGPCLCLLQQDRRSLHLVFSCTLCSAVLDSVAQFLLHLASWKKALSKSLPGVRLIKSIAVAVAQTLLCCCFRTAPTAFTWTSRVRRGKVGHCYRILLLLATDAARRPVLNVVLCGDRRFQQYVVDACAKMEQQWFNQNSFRT